MSHFYTTTVFDEEDDITGEFMFVPVRFIPPGAVADGPEQVAGLLGLEDLRPIQSGWLIRAVAQLAASQDALFVHSWGHGDAINTSLQVPQNRHYRFAEKCTMAPIIPIENSPLEGKSLGEMITRASGVSLGAYVGFAISNGSPLVFVLVPAGMILFGASAGLARGLEEGVRERVKRALTIKGSSRRTKI